MTSLSSRQFYGGGSCYDRNSGQYYSCQSTWSSWGRWVALGAIVVIAFITFFLFSCLTARRRKRRGLQPYYGTGWVPYGHGPATYNPNYQNQQPAQSAPPQYESNGGYYGQNQGYFSGQQNDTELQQPQNAYGGNDNVYQPPVGPPPKK